MDICQQKKVIINGIRIQMKLYQHEDPFRLMAETTNGYKVEIQYASLRVCQVKLSPAMVVAHEKRIPIYGSIPCEIKIVLCSGSALLHMLDTILVHCILHVLGTILVHCLI